MAAKATRQAKAKAPGMAPEGTLAEPSPPPQADGQTETYTPVVLTARFPWGGVEFLPGPMKVSGELFAAMQKAGVLAEPET